MCSSGFPFCAADLAETLKSPANAIGRPVPGTKGFCFSLYYNLCGALWRCARSQIHRTLQPDRAAIGAEPPAIAIGLDQKRAHGITRQGGADIGVQVKADRKAPAHIDIVRRPIIDGPEQRILAADIATIGRQENPRRLEMLLNSILPPEKRVNYFD